MKCSNVLFITVCLVATAALGSERMASQAGPGGSTFSATSPDDCPDLIAAGYDLWESARDGEIFPPDFDFGSGATAHAPALPADFFGPGSDPFTGQISLVGDPFQTTPADAFGQADAIVQRFAQITIPDPSSPPTVISVELIALSLISTDPIVVTFNGGQNPEAWDVKVCLAETTPSFGTMSLSSDCCEGGSIHTELNIMPKFIFTRPSTTLELIMDFSLEGLPAVPWVIDGSWALDLTPPIIPDPIIVSGGCHSAITDVVIGPSPQILVTGDAGAPWFGDPCSTCPNPIAAGYDLWESGRDGDLFPPIFNFGLDAPPLPADFFGPGSDPFVGQVDLAGTPIQTIPAGDFGLTDAIWLRPGPALIPDPLSSPQTIPIEIVALSLNSTQPITVTFNGGQDPEEWDVKVCLSEVTPSPGTMEISSDCCNGGTFHTELGIMPRFTFIRVADGQEAVFDYAWLGDPAVSSIIDGRWAVENSPPDIPGPVQIDHDCYAGTADIIVGPSPRLFVTGGLGTPWFGDLCSGCCVGRVGDVNGSGDDEPTIGDVSVLIDAKFITGDCNGIIECFTEADINQSGGTAPDCDDVTIGDISYLIDYLFITGPSLNLPDCL